MNPGRSSHGELESASALAMFWMISAPPCGSLTSWSSFILFLNLTTPYLALFCLLDKLLMVLQLHLLDFKLVKLIPIQVRTDCQLPRLTHTNLLGLLLLFIWVWIDLGQRGDPSSKCYTRLLNNIGPRKTWHLFGKNFFNISLLSNVKVGKNHAIFDFCRYFVHTGKFPLHFHALRRLFEFIAVGSSHLFCRFHRHLSVWLGRSSSFSLVTHSSSSSWRTFANWTYCPEVNWL